MRGEQHVCEEEGEVGGSGMVINESKWDSDVSFMRGSFSFQNVKT